MANKHTTATDYTIVIKTTFYQQQPHKYFNLIILLNFNHIKPK